MALAYERIFRVPVTTLFVGLQASIAKQVEDRLTELETKLGKQSAFDRDAKLVAQKLMWLRTRKT
jgi:hypothetical protein